MVWKIHEAKARLSEVIERARREGAQTLARHGTARAVLLAIEDYQALVAGRPDFKDYLLGGPKIANLRIARNADAGREVEL